VTTAGFRRRPRLTSDRSTSLVRELSCDEDACDFDNRTPVRNNRICVLAHNLRTAGGLSVGRNIVATLPQVAPTHDYLMIVPAKCGYPTRRDDGHVSIREVPQTQLPGRCWFDSLELPRIVRKFGATWIWALGNVGLVRPPCRQAILFHDPHLIYPESSYAFESRWYRTRKRLLKRRVRQCLKVTERVFCQTETARRRFADTFDYPPDRIGICPNGISYLTDGSGGHKTPAPLARYGDWFKLLVLAKCYGHKNLQGILETYKQFREQLADTLCVWTIAADQHPIAPALLEAIRREGLSNLILNVGPLEQSQLKAYFSACDALLLPSLLESFSGTYIEAMRFERPIITSDLDFAHEICGEAAEYVDPLCPASIRDGICRLRDNPEYAAELVERGRRRMTSFIRTWPDILRSVLDELEIEHE